MKASETRVKIKLEGFCFYWSHISPRARQDLGTLSTTANVQKKNNDIYSLTVYTHIHTYTHTYAHIYTHIYSHILTYTIYTHTHTYTHTPYT